MKVADAHCDTLTKYPNNIYNSGNAHWNIDKFKSCGGVLQYFAIFTPAQFVGDSAMRFAVNSIGNFLRNPQQEINFLENKDDYDESKINILLSIEGAGPIINDISNLYAFYKLGVRAMGLTWNHRNFVADGIDTDYGLTPFGIEVIKEMEKLCMIIDVSHLNEAGFNDVVKHTSKPFIASHSNARAIFDHRRNLHDEQIREIISRGGFVGINFYSEFIGSAENDLKIELIRHIEHILSLGGENIIGMGADFDGIPETPFPDASSYISVAELLGNELKLSENVIEKIMYRNLVDCTLKLI
ncbi:MAG: membrane dipeptidase [Candidatus Kapabacteria bacterium]|nr:membrane dipeptidase [Ignavibacteriota bacterium]MCW5885048.1 membrane dipeptidase [Candidatus Kapabacteria bacterium]